jgi:hypothetical protein
MRSWLIAILIGIALSWLISSLWPLTLLVSLATLILLYRERRLSQYLELLIPQLSRPVKTFYHFNLQLGEQLWNTLSLTTAERTFVETNPVRYVDFVLEEWSDGVTRVKVTQSGSGDVYYLQPGYLDLWQIKLGNHFGAPQISVILSEWRDPKTVQLCVSGGHFKEPDAGFTLFEIPIPFLSRANFDYKQLQEPMQKFRTFESYYYEGSDPSKGGTGIDCRWNELYICDNLMDKGFKWTLRRRDLRKVLDATVVRIHKKGRQKRKAESQSIAYYRGYYVGWLWRLLRRGGDHEVIAYTLRLNQLGLSGRHKTGLKIGASALVVENDCAGQNTLHEGEVVSLFLDLDKNEAGVVKVDRIVPRPNYYAPVKCPQCKQPRDLFMPRFSLVNSDGVCLKCRPRQRCYRCGKEFDPKFLREEHGELVCSSDRCNVVCPVCGEMLGEWGLGFTHQEAYVNGKWATVHLECKKKVEPTWDGVLR